ncbi:MAG: rhodanese-like domain-containing protein [Gammaproteobacteria bacterium]
MYRYSLGIIIAFIFCSTSYAESESSNPAPNKQTPQALYLTATEAYQLKKIQPNEVFFVDVRTQAEVEFVGVADIIDVNIPYIFNGPDDWDEEKNRFGKPINSNFSVALEDKLTKAGFDKNTTIILMCRSGKRSAKAANLLHQLKYTKAYTVIDGFEGDKVKTGPNKGKRKLNGWKNSDLPWSYKLEEEKMYLE